MKFTLPILIACVTILKSTITFAKTAEEWKSRSVYQIITDRFARSNDADNSACNLLDYCGGTFNGIRQNLDYIQGMGFDAIWISPVVANTDKGYHGYWTKDLYAVNENFGTEEELIELINECHSRNVWVMVDVVANHMGYFENWNYSSLAPFNDISHYNKYVECGEFNPADPEQFNHVETCWLSGLPDLDQNNPFVRSTLLKWAKDFTQTYNIDALRIDTVPHVSKSFWSEFSREAGVFTIGEILSFDLPFLAGYQGSVDSVLNYALYSSLREVFQNRGSMNKMEVYYERAHDTWVDISVLGNFVNNHDNHRFLAGSDSQNCFKSALAFSISSVGIPMVYYGDEQAFSGGQDPANREPLFGQMNRDSEIYKFLSTINNFRKESQFYEHHQVQRYSDDTFYAFSRGDVFFAFTNSDEYQSKTVNYHPYEDGTLLCNILHKDDCVKVEGGAFPVILVNGEVKIFTPSKVHEEASIDAKKLANLVSLKSANLVGELFKSAEMFWGSSL